MAKNRKQGSIRLRNLIKIVQELRSMPTRYAHLDERRNNAERQLRSIVRTQMAQHQQQLHVAKRLAASNAAHVEKRLTVVHTAKAAQEQKTRADFACTIDDLMSK